MLSLFVPRGRIVAAEHAQRQLADQLATVERERAHADRRAAEYRRALLELGMGPTVHQIDTDLQRRYPT